MTDGVNGVKDVIVAVEGTGVTGTTGAAGGCTLRSVPVGRRVISATKSGYESYSHEELVTSETTNLSITLTAL